MLNGRPTSLSEELDIAPLISTVAQRDIFGIFASQNACCLLRCQPVAVFELGVDTP